MQGVLHKTLIIRLSSVGDVLLSSPLVRSLRGRFPDCQIDFLVKSAYADLVRHNPHVARVIEFPDDGTLADLGRLRSVIRSTGYELIIDIHDSIRSRFVASGARRVTRVNKRKIARALLVKFKVNVYNSFGGAPAVPERYLETVHALGVLDDGKGLEIFVPDEIQTAIRRRLAEVHGVAGTRCIGVCPSAMHFTKMWSEKRFAAAAGQLAAQSGVPVLLFGSTAERERCATIARHIELSYPSTMTVNLAGVTSLLETAAAMDHCAVVITNDTGLMHMAVARTIPVVAVFGPTVRQFGFFPPASSGIVIERSGLPCRPCSHIGLPRCPVGHFRCMEDIQVDTVVAAAERLLKGT